MIRGVELAYQVTGTGQPVVLVHAGVLGAVWFDPLVTQPPLTDGYRLLRYDRAGYGKAGGARHRCRLPTRPRNATGSWSTSDSPAPTSSATPPAR